MHEFAPIFVVGMLLIIGGTWLAPKLRVAAPIILVFVGIACSFIPGAEPFEVEPELVLAIVLPPILYAAAVSVPMTDFRRNFKAISGLSVVLVLLSAIVVGLFVTWLLPGVPLAAGIALGAVVAPPDAVAATAMGKRLGLPSTLVTVLEGEGLVNDATALVLLRSAIAAMGGTVTWLGIAGDFVFAVVAAIAIGLVVGWTTVLARSHIDQPTLTTAISFTVPFLAFWPAEAVGASGVLSVVVAGLVTGFRSASHLSAQDRISERVNWHTIQLLLENGVFLLMGWELRHFVDEVEHEHLSVSGAVLVGLVLCLILLVVRVAFIVPLVWTLRRDQQRASDRLARSDDWIARIEAAEPHVDGAQAKGLSVVARRLQRRRHRWSALATDGLGWRGGAVLSWSGMRGVVTVAAAQTLPHDVPLRAQLILIAFVVALVTLVLYGLTLPVVIRWLGVSGPDAEAHEREVHALVEEILKASAERLRSPDLRRRDGKPFDRAQIEAMITNRARLAHSYGQPAEGDPSSEIAQRAALYRIMLDAEQAALVDARSVGAYPATVLEWAQIAIGSDVARMTQRGRRGH